MRIEDGLIEADALMKRGGAAIVKSTGKIVAAITVIITVLLTFTDITFSSFGTASFTSTLAVMLTASYLMYFSLEDAGEKLGEDSAEYAECMRKYKAIRERISGKDIGEMREWCSAYSRRDLEFRRSNFLLAHGFSDADLKAFESGVRYTPTEIRIFKRARRMKSIPLTPVSLLSGKGENIKSELYDNTRHKALRMTLKLLPTTLFMCVTVSVILTLKDGLSAATVIESIVKLSTLPIVGFRGYAAGYGYVKGGVIPRIDTKRRILESFLSEHTS